MRLIALFVFLGIVVAYSAVMTVHAGNCPSDSAWFPWSCS